MNASSSGAKGAANVSCTAKWAGRCVQTSPLCLGFTGRIFSDVSPVLKSVKHCRSLVERCSEKLQSCRGWRNATGLFVSSRVSRNRMFGWARHPPGRTVSSFPVNPELNPSTSKMRPSQIKLPLFCLYLPLSPFTFLHLIKVKLPSAPGSAAEFVGCSVRLSLEEDLAVFSLNLWAPVRLKAWSFRRIEEQLRVWHFLLLLPHTDVRTPQTWTSSGPNISAQSVEDDALIFFYQLVSLILLKDPETLWHILF